MSAARSAYPRLAERPSIWVVDDSRLQAELCGRVLGDRCEVTLFDDGVTLLEKLASGPTPDLLIVDWHMPNLSGLEVCRFVRKMADRAQLPVLIITATAQPESLLEALEAGANDFLRKPFPEAELEARVAALVRTRRLHATLADAERRLRIEADFRERFMGMLAHDLRQPLNTVSLANQLLQDPANEAESGKFLGMQQRAAERMKRMIAELLDFARSRPADGMPIERRLVDFGHIASTALEEMRIGHPDRPLKLHVKGACNGLWDADRLAQICSNLVGNAIEYGTPASAVEVAVVCLGDQVELRVSNEGPRIAEELLPSLFEPFQRGRGSRPRNGSLGLGLYIVDQIVRAHGGTITVESEERITHFRVNLPRAIQTNEKA